MSMSCVRGIFGWIRDGQDIAPRTLRCSLELIFFRTPTRWAGREKEFQLFLSPTAPDTGIRESRAGPVVLSPVPCTPGPSRNGGVLLFPEENRIPRAASKTRVSKKSVLCFCLCQKRACSTRGLTPVHLCTFVHVLAIYSRFSRETLT